MDHKVIDLIKEIGEIAEANFDNLVSWEDVKSWPVGESRRIGQSTNTKIFSDDKRARFTTVIDPGGYFDKKGHWHDFDEKCNIKAGKMRDELSGRVWGIDEVAHFPFGKKHLICNGSQTDYCHIEVNFDNVTREDLK